MVTLLGAACRLAAWRLMEVVADVATVVPEIRSCSVSLATEVTPAAGKKEEATYKLQSAVPLAVDSSVTLHAGRSTCGKIRAHLLYLLELLQEHFSSQTSLSTAVQCSSNAAKTN
jgi:hypothetical protein